MANDLHDFIDRVIGLVKNHSGDGLVAKIMETKIEKARALAKFMKASGDTVRRAKPVQDSRIVCIATTLQPDKNGQGLSA